MKPNFKLTLKTKKSPEEVFQAIGNVRQWWTGYHDEKFTGRTKALNDEFTFHAAGGIHYSKQKLVEVVPNKKIVWLVTDSVLGFVEKTDEWKGSKIIFEISTTGNTTQLVF